MTEDVKPEVIKKTQDILGKYFKKPPLTEKLLKKPPFRFLHDIVSSVIRETGFLDGLFTEDELNSENIKDKDTKLAYLTKLIDVVKLITGNNLMVRPSKVIAGHEPTRTNELLQAIGKALDKKISSAEAIEHYKNSNGRSKGPVKSKLVAKDESKKPVSRQSSQSRKPVEKEKPPIDQKKKSTSTSKNAPKEVKTRAENRREKLHEQEKENKAKNKGGDKKEKIVEIPSAESKEEKRPSSVRRQRRSASVQPKEDPSSPKTLDSPKTKPALSDSTNSPTHKMTESSLRNTNSPIDKQVKSQQGNNQTEQPPDRISEPETRQSAEIRGKTSANDDGSRRSSHSDGRTKRSAEKNSAPLEGESKPKSSAGNKVREASSLLSPNHKSSKSDTVPNKLQKQYTFEHPGSPPPKPGPPDDSANTAIVPETTVVRPKTSLRPPSARPMSARPAAPRMRSKTEFILNEDITTPMGTVNVIVENFDTKEEDDVDDMVVMETGGSGDSLNIDGLARTESQLSEEHGHLVAQILETQRELINTDNVDVMPKKVEIEWEAGSRRDRETAIKEVDKLRSSIQTLTRATNPLGKLLDYLQEDVEMMQRELHEWRSQYNQLSEQLRQEQISTEEFIEPMKGTLKDIEGNIKVQLDKIRQVKAGIMKNDQKIQRLLNGHL
ncbi:TRAF3-interacting protein 1 isoform X1 [Neodiprion virginianus]|uniref:TRAF3-interacting protein 1 isoform X1 n=2 Tax=Neodiprion virginianus TaxID=2961670 RepID=UPI001EE6E601|nr:TRAF3-interacting protein 1 isoform X1 [Neodiprion virginianus]